MSFHDEIRKFHDLKLAHAKGPSHVHQNITRNITFYIMPDRHVCYGTFPFSMTFDIF